MLACKLEKLPPRANICKVSTTFIQDCIRKLTLESQRLKEKRRIDGNRQLVSVGYVRFHFKIVSGSFHGRGNFTSASPHHLNFLAQFVA